MNFILFTVQHLQRPCNHWYTNISLIRINICMHLTSFAHQVILRKCKSPTVTVRGRVYVVKIQTISPVSNRLPNTSTQACYLKPAPYKLTATGLYENVIEKWDSD